MGKAIPVHTGRSLHRATAATKQDEKAHALVSYDQLRDCVEHIAIRADAAALHA